MAHDKNMSPVGWYLASYLLRFVELEDAKRNDPEKRFTSWENTVLVQAENLDEAFLKASKIARESATPFLAGPEGIPAKWEFEGITELLPVYEEIKDGAEIAWADHAPRKLKNLRSLVKKKEAFRQ